MTLWELINSVQDQSADPSVGREAWPEDRKRTLNGLKLCEPIIPRLRKLDLELRERVDREIPALKDQVESFRSRPDKETIIGQLGEEEILRRFTDPVFRSFAPSDVIGHFKADDVLQSLPPADVLAFAFKQLFTTLESIQLQLAQHVNDDSLHRANGHANGANGHSRVKGIPVLKPVNLPRVAFFGLQQHHLEILRSHVGSRCEIIFVPKGEMQRQIDVPPNCEHIVVWENNVTAHHKRVLQRTTPHEKLSVYSGTFTEVLSRLQSLAVLGRGKVKPK
jgi:hypothetical protein